MPDGSLELSGGSATQQQGAKAEDRAMRFLQAKGLILVARNVRWRGGEIDLIVRDDETIVFVEVRSRTRNDFGGAVASVSAAKQRRIIQTAQGWMLRHFGQSAWPAMRFDVVSLQGASQDQASIDWIASAFSGHGW